MGWKTMDVSGTIKRRAKTLVGKRACYSRIPGGYVAEGRPESACGKVLRVERNHIRFGTKHGYSRVPIESIISLTDRKRLPKR